MGQSGESRGNPAGVIFSTKFRALGRKSRVVRLLVALLLGLAAPLIWAAEVYPSH